MATTEWTKTSEEVWQQFDRDYSSRPAYFGGKASRALLRCLPGQPRPFRVLDLGSGPGRNALALARRGCTVTAVDRADAAVEQLNQEARREGLAVDGRCCDVRDMHFEPESFHMVAAVTVLGHLETEELVSLAPRIARWLKPRGLLFAEEFSTDDPGCGAGEDASEYAPLVRHYFASGELERLFPSLQCCERRLFQVTDRTHGQLHEHGLIRFLARKPT